MLHKYLTVSSCPFRAAQSKIVHSDASRALMSNASVVLICFFNSSVSPNLFMFAVFSDAGDLRARVRGARGEGGGGGGGDLAWQDYEPSDC